MDKLLVVSRKFPPSVGGTQTVLKNLFMFFDPEEYFVVHDDEKHNQERSFSYRDLRVDFPYFLREILGKALIPLYVFLIPVIVLSLVRLHRRERFDKCLIVYPDPFFSVAGYLFARLVKLGYVLYFHDLFGEAQTKRTRIVQKVLARLFEKRMIEQSQEFLVISEGLKAFYSSKCKISSIVLPHSIDLASFDLHKTPKRREIRKGPLKVVYSGEVYDNQYDAVLAFVNALRDSEISYELTFTSKMPREHFEALNLVDENTVIRFFPNRKDVFKLQRSADILYLPLAFESPVPLEVKTSLPTKIIEYVASMRPIFVHCPSDSFLAEFCEKNKIGTVCTSCNKQDVVPTLEKALASGVDTEHRIRFLENYDRRKISARFRALLGLVSSKNES